MKTNLPKIVLILFFVVFLLNAKAQHFEQKQRSLDSLWTIVQAVENTYRANATHTKTRVSKRGKRTRITGYRDRVNGELSYYTVIFVEKTRYYRSGLTRRWLQGYQVRSKARIPAFELKTYGNNIVYADILPDGTSPRIRIIDNRLIR